MRTLCFGDAIVDLICQRPVASYDEVDAFVPALGGVIANVAATAARQGAAVSFAGGAGADRWGRWLHERLDAAGVDLRWFDLAPGHATAVAFTTVDEQGEPTWELYGDGVAASLEALDGLLLGAVDETDALLFTSNTLADRAAARAHDGRTRAARSSSAGPSSSIRACGPIAGATARAARPPRATPACPARFSSSATPSRRGS